MPDQTTFRRTLDYIIVGGTLNVRPEIWCVTCISYDSDKRVAGDISILLFLSLDGLSLDRGVPAVHLTKICNPPSHSNALWRSR